MILFKYRLNYVPENLFCMLRNRSVILSSMTETEYELQGIWLKVTFNPRVHSVLFGLAKHSSYQIS